MAVQSWSVVEEVVTSSMKPFFRLEDDQDFRVATFNFGGKRKHHEHNAKFFDFLDNALESGVHCVCL